MAQRYSAPAHDVEGEQTRMPGQGNALGDEEPVVATTRPAPKIYNRTT